MLAKFLVEGAFLLILTIIFQYYIISATISSLKVRTAYTTYATASESERPALINTYTSEAKNYYEASQI